MKIKAFHIETKKSEEEIYNDGTNKNVNTEVLYNYDISKEENVNFFTNSKTDKEIKESLVHPHAKEISRKIRNKNNEEIEVTEIIHEDTTVENIIDENISPRQKENNISSEYLEDSTPSILKGKIIRSNIDGEIGFTNVQDTNLSGGDLEDVLEDSLKLASGGATNALGITGSEISNVAGAFANIGLGEQNTNAYEESMNKLNDWRSKKYKEIHTYDWKPGQTIPQGALSELAMGLMKIDEVNHVRNSIKAEEGIFEDSIIRPQEDEYAKKEKKSPKFFTEWNKSEKETRYINALKNKNIYNKTLGYIYIKPNYNYGEIDNLKIPFEFNPEITEDGTQANYSIESLMNRIGQFNIYTGTNLSNISINLNYMALSPDEMDDEMYNSMSKQFSTDSWQYYWTNNRIEQIEYQLRSLVFPDVTSSNYLIKPPIIEIHIGNDNGTEAQSVGDLFKYPIGIFDNESGDKINAYKNDEKKYLSVSRDIDEKNFNRYKKYIVTSVQISNLDSSGGDIGLSYPSLYGRVWDKTSNSGAPINHIKTGKDLDKETKSAGYSGYARRTGFRATLQCTEITENFLDIVPDFRAYYNAWNYKKDKADETSEYSRIIFNEKLEETADFFNASFNEAIDKLSSLDDRLNAYFNEAYLIARLYKEMMSKESRLFMFNSQAIGDSSVDKNGDYYFANSNWVKKDNSPIEKIDPNSPVAFKVKLSSDVSNFLKDILSDKDTEELLKGSSTFLNKYKDVVVSNKNNLQSSLNNYNSLEGMEFLYHDKYNSLYKNDLLEYKKTLPKFIDIYDSESEYSDQECITIAEILKKNAEYYIKLKDKLPQKIEDQSAYVCNVLISKINNTDIKIEVEDCKDYFKKLSDKFSPMIDEFISFYDTNYKSTIFEKLKATFIEQGGEESKVESLKNKFIVLEDFKKSSIELLENLRYSTEELSIFDISKYFESLTYVVDLFNFVNNNTKKYSKFKTEKAIKPIIDLQKKMLYNTYLYKETLNKNIDLNYSITKAGEEVIDSICNSMLYGNKVKVIGTKNSNLSCKVSIPESSKNNKTNFTSREECMDLTGRFDMDTYISDDTNIELLNVIYIYNQMIKSFEDSMKNIKKLMSDVHKYNLKYENAIIPENFNYIKFEKLTNDQELSNQEAATKNGYLSMVGEVRSLKVGLGKENTQLLFSKVAGYDPETAKLENKAPVLTLKSLKEGYVEYSKNIDSLRKSAYSEWDKFESMVMANNGKSVAPGGFEKNYSNEDNGGQIPKIYYDKLKSEELKNKMSIAGNSINNFGKLT